MSSVSCRHLSVYFFINREADLKVRVSLLYLFFSAMAGNIIPAIATTNAVIAGLIVLEGLKILSGQIESCRTVSLVSSLHGRSCSCAAPVTVFYENLLSPPDLPEQMPQPQEEAARPVHPGSAQCQLLRVREQTGSHSEA